MKIRRVVATLLVLAMMLVCLPIQVFAATSGTCGENVTWKLNAYGVLTISGKGPMNDYTLSKPAPWHTEIDGANKVTTVYIQEGVSSIGNYAFQNLFALLDVTIPSTVTRIGMRAFEGCSKLGQIKLPAGLKEIGHTAFHRTAVTEMVFPEEITTVPASVLYECTELQSVQFLGPIVDIGGGAFSGCTSLTSVSFSQGWTGQIGSSAFKGCKNLVNFDLPSGVTSIGDEAFRDCMNLNTVVFPNTLISIGEEAYASCQSISSVAIPKSVISLGRSAFMDCTNLKTVTMHASTVDGIGKKTYNIFYNSPLEYAHIHGDEPEEKTNLFGTRDYYFVVYYDKEANGWDGLTWSGHVIKAWGDDSYDFGGTIGDNITWTLKGDVLTISGTGSVVGVGGGQAPWYSVKELVKKLVIEEGITDFGSAAFSLNRMTEIQIADTVTILPNFEKCHSLEVVTVPASVKETGAFLFRDSGVKTVYFEGDAPKFHAAAFAGPGFGGSDHLTVMYPAGNDTWTEEVRQDYGGNVTWIPYCNHNYETVTVEADCITPGTTSHICSKCGDTQVEPGWTPPLGHDYGLDENGDPDFWDTTCDVCGAEREVDKHRPTHSMYRMYNPNSGEHFYTGSMKERKDLEAAGWMYEGVGFTFPATTGKPVYRLYDKDNTMEHLYTMDEEEKDRLLAEGWISEGVAFNSGREDEVPQYRLHNPNATIGAYHFTASAEERDNLISLGWEYQGIGFYTCLQ